MQKRKLLIAEGSEELTCALEELFRGNCQLRTCSEGDRARYLISQFRPDVLVLDLMLPGYDGLSLLQWLRDQEYHPQVLATTRFWNDYVVEQAQSLGVRYLVRKPCSISALSSRISDLLSRAYPEEIPRRETEGGLRPLLTALGVPGKLRGYTYLRYAIPMYAGDPLQSVTKVLYPRVAKQCGCQPSHVERSIRSAIEAAWKRRDENIWKLYFPTDETGTVIRPTNGTFIARLAEQLVQCGDYPAEATEIVQNIPETPRDVRE